MWVLIRKMLVGFFVLALSSYFVSLVFNESDVVVYAVAIFFGLILVSWFLAVVSSIAALVNYKLFGDDLANRMADAISQSGGLPEPEKFAFDIDEYLHGVREAEVSTKGEIALVSEMIGMRDVLKSNGHYVALFISGKLIRTVLGKLAKN